MTPGTRLVELDIAAEHRVSRTPVHEAVQRLSEEGLVEILQRVGTFVSRIPVDELEDAMLVRTALEVALIQKAVGAHHAGSRTELLRGILEEQRRCDVALDLPGFHHSDDSLLTTALATIAALPGRVANHPAIEDAGRSLPSSRRCRSRAAWKA